MAAYDPFSNNGGSNYDSFSSSQQGGGNFVTPSQGTMKQYAADGGSGGKQKYNRDTQNMLPVCVRMVLNASDDQGNGKLSIDGRPLSQVVMVVNVLSLQVRETHLAMEIEDGTGQISAKLSTDHDQAPINIIEGNYYTCHGQPRKLGGSVVVSAFDMVPVEDHNVITKHLLDVIATSLKASGAPKLGEANGQRPASSVAAAAVGGMHMNGNGNGAMKYEQGIGGGQQQQQYAPQQNGYNNGMNDLPAGMPSTGDAIRDQVLAAFATGPDAHTDGGCSTQSVAQYLSHLSFIQVQEAIAGLSNDGHLYSTIDEEHYKTTSS